MAIKLSKRQIGDADRVGGIELMILWPKSLGREPTDLGVNKEREASATEKAEGERLVESECRAHGLVPVHVRVANVRRAGSLPEPGDRVHLAVTIIGRRWVHASTRNRGRTCFAQTIL